MKDFETFTQEEKSEKLDNYEEIALVEDMIRILFCDKENIDALVISFLTIASKLNLKLPELYKLYVGKNILNKFRQEHGYKEGSYIKVWNGEEDNIVMQRILNNKNEITPNALYGKLEEAYPKG